MGQEPNLTSPGPSLLPSCLRVLVVDGHAGVRTALCAVLGSAGVAAPRTEAADGPEALERLRHDAFDLALVDVAPRRMSGFELLRRLRADGSQTPVLMLSTHAGPGYALRAFEAGANGYSGKDAPAPDLVRAAGTVAAGGSHVPEPVADRVRVLPHGRVRVEPHACLSARELRLLKLLARGLPEAEAARQLRLAPDEASRSLERITQKLRLSASTDWRLYGQTHGLG